jgi:hypothetical protein
VIVTRLKLIVVGAIAAALVSPTPAAAWPTNFDFTKSTNLNSTLTIVWQQIPGHFSTVSWRAGSGTSTDSCWISHGWLPNGWYDLWGHWNNYDGSAIKGRVFYLQNKQCWNGTWRTELFVHSEETAGNGQYCPSPYDDPFCWEGDSDYYSNGCIKVSHWNDIGGVHQAWHDKSGDYRHGSFGISNWIYVH